MLTICSRNYYTICIETFIAWYNPIVISAWVGADIFATISSFIILLVFAYIFCQFLNLILSNDLFQFNRKNNSLYIIQDFKL